MKQIAKYMTMASAISLAACGGDSFDFDLDPSSDSVVGTSNYNVYVPEGMDKVQVNDPHFDGFMLGAGSALANIPTAAVTTYSARDVVAFVAEREVRIGETSGAAVLSAIESELQTMAAGGSYANILKQQLNGTDQMIGSYLITLPANSTVTPVAVDLIGEVALDDDAATDDLANPPVALEGEALTTDFEVYVGVFYNDLPDGLDAEGNLIEDQVVILAAVVPADIAAAYSSVSKGVTSTSNVGSQTSTVASNSESFTAQSGSNKADFLFVIDNSGSMSDDQDAISAAADAFVDVIAASGLDAQFGTITTDSSVLLDTNTDGGYTTSTSELKADVKPGSGGSATESGIYHAEESLATGGSSVTAGHPRAGASMSVIMLSDETDQYTGYASSSFDASNNLFVTNNYQVYGILSTLSSEGRSNGYVDLINNTNGTYADITNLLAFDRIMEEIALNAGAASSRIQLTNTPIRNTISVTVDGSAVAEDSANGWQYNESLKTIAFFGTSKPTGGESITVSYQYRVGN